MPTLQIPQQTILMFESKFKLLVEQRTGQQYSSINEAYFSYLSMDEQKRKNFWELIATHINMPRERVYKFFRFTWTRQFYTKIEVYKEEIRQFVIDTLDEFKLNQKDHSLNSMVWNKVWSKYKSCNLHYDGTDQFVRNCVNLYFTKKQVTFETKTVQEKPPKEDPTPIEQMEKNSIEKCYSQSELEVIRQIDNIIQQQQPVVYNDTYNYIGREEISDNYHRLSAFELYNDYNSEPASQIDNKWSESVEIDSYGDTAYEMQRRKNNESKYKNSGKSSVVRIYRNGRCFVRSNGQIVEICNNMDADDQQCFTFSEEQSDYESQEQYH